MEKKIYLELVGEGLAHPALSTALFRGFTLFKLIFIKNEILFFSLKETLDLSIMPMWLNLQSEISNFVATFRMLFPRILEPLVVKCKPT